MTLPTLPQSRSSARANVAPKLMSALSAWLDRPAPPLPVGVPDLAMAHVRFTDGVAALKGERVCAGHALAASLHSLLPMIDVTPEGGAMAAATTAVWMSATCDDLEEWGPAAVSGSWDVFDAPAKAHHADGLTLASVMDFAVRPNMRAAAATIATLWASTPARNATCPACGAPPLLVEVASDGARMLRCVRCAAAWSMRADMCPTCGAGDQHRRTLPGTAGQSSPRAECCDACGHYLKVIDTSTRLTPGTLLTQDVETAGLDRAAAEAGYA